jgi:peptidylprolyl isomerase
MISVVFSGRRRLAAVALAAGFAASALSPPGVAEAADQPGADAVARLGSTDISAAQLRDYVRSLDPAVRKQALADPNVLNRLVRQELARMAVLSEAAAQKWDQRPDVAARIQRAKEDAIATSFLASVAAVPADYPSEAQIAAAYEQNHDSFMVARQYHLAQIYVAVADGADKKAEDAAQKKADDLARKAKAKGVSFDELARANSDDKATADKGGDMGWNVETQIVPEIRAQIAGLTPGEISEPIKVGRGWHIIRMIETKPAAPRPLAEVKEGLITYLRQHKLQDNEQAYLTGLLDKTPIAVNEIGLRRIFEAAP